MNSLAILAHAGHARPPAFNAFFYATVATVIPVLFVGLALQADVYTEMLGAGRAAGRRLDAATGLRESIKALTLFVATLILPAAILIYGVWGEIQAFLDLYLQHPVGPIGPLRAVGPLIAVIGLILVAAIGPATKYASTLKEIDASDDAGKQQPPLAGKTGAPTGQGSP